MKRSRKNKLSLCLVGIFISLVGPTEAQKSSGLMQGTFVVAYEICSDSTIFGCWTANQADYHMLGLIPFDSVKNKVNPEKGYFIYLSDLLSPKTVDSIEYLHLTGKNTVASSSTWQLNVELPFDSVLRLNFSKKNFFKAKDPKLTKLLLKERKRKRIFEQYLSPNNIDPRSHKLTGDKDYYLFLIDIQFKKSEIYFSDRMLVNSRGRIKKIHIPYYFITKVTSLNPYTLKK